VKCWRKRIHSAPSTLPGSPPDYAMTFYAYTVHNSLYLGHRAEIDAYLKQSEASLMISAVVRVQPIRCYIRSSTKLDET